MALVESGQRVMWSILWCGQWTSEDECKKSDWDQGIDTPPHLRWNDQARTLHSYGQTEHVHEGDSSVYNRIRNQVGEEQLTITLGRRENMKFLFIYLFFNVKVNFYSWKVIRIFFIFCFVPRGKERWIEIEGVEQTTLRLCCAMLSHFSRVCLFATIWTVTR